MFNANIILEKYIRYNKIFTGISVDLNVEEI